MADPSMDDMFAGMKKKKKSSSSKKALLEELDAEVEGPKASVESNKEESVPEPSAATAAPVSTEDDLDFSDLKKKKKKKTVRIAGSDEEIEPVQKSAPTTTTTTTTVDKLGNETVVPVETAPAQEDKADDSNAFGDEFADLKKKKKKGGKKAAFDLEAFEKELAAAESNDVSTPEGGSQVPSKTGTPAGSDDERDDGDDPFSSGGAGGADGDAALSKAEAAAKAKAWLAEDRDYHYIELLGRFYNSLYASHPGLQPGGKAKKYTLAPPQMLREGNKRSIFANIGDICKKMHRQPEHVIQFLFAELGTTGSVDGGGRLVIKGRFQQKQVEAVLRRYIVEYVTCRTCKSPDTMLTKDNRLFFLTCGSCGSTRSVAAIKSGFQAQVGKRKAQRAAG